MVKGVVGRSKEEGREEFKGELIYMVGEGMFNTSPLGYQVIRNAGDVRGFNSENFADVSIKPAVYFGSVRSKKGARLK